MKRARADSKRISGFQGAFLVHEVGFVQGEQDLNERCGAAKQASGDVEDIVSRCGRARELKHEAGVVKKL